MAVRADDVDIERDAALVERFQAGDEAAFAELYRRYYARLRRACHRRLGDAFDADEAAQEALVRAYRALPRFGGSRRFYPWVRVIAANVCADMRRRPQLADVPSPGGGDPVLDAVVDAADRQQVRQAMADMAPRQQAALSLWAEGWPSSHIAAELGCTAGAADVTVHRARQSFRRHYLSLVDDKALAGLGGIGAALRWAHRVRGRVAARVSRHADLLSPAAERAMAGVVALTVLGGAAGGAAAKSPSSAPVAAVTAARAASSAPAPSAPAAPSASTPSTVAHVGAAGARAQANAAAASPAARASAAIGPARFMSYDDARAEGKKAGLRAELAGAGVGVDGKAAVKFVHKTLEGTTP